MKKGGTLPNILSIDYSKCVSLYIFHGEDDILSHSVDYQRTECMKYIERNGWNLYEEYVDSCKVDVPLYERPGIQQLLSDINNKNIRNHTVVFYSIMVLGLNSIVAYTFIEEMQERRIIIANAEEKSSTTTPCGVLTLQMGTATNIYIRKALEKVYFFFSRKQENDRSPNEYKGCFKTEHELRLLLSQCKDDTYLQIMSPSNMHKYFEYKATSNLRDESENCVELFTKDIC